MSGFEALFAFYGLLLGLAIAAVASGFAEQWRRRRRQPIGPLVSLLALYVLLAATQQWLSFWNAREGFEMEPLTLLMCLGMALPYTFVAQVMFPTADDDVASADAHYLADRRVLLGVLMMPLALSLGYNMVLNGFVMPDLLRATIAWFLPLALLVLLIVTARRGWQVAGLALLVADRLWKIFS